jgi:pimeloyl-ACP methyl ester carboxylesterase
MKIKSSSKYFLGLTLMTVALLNSAFAAVEKLNLNLSPNRLISLELVKGSDPKLPTLLFLPGVNRSLLAKEKALQLLAKKGFGVATMNFSVQPFSVSQLEESVAPEFLSKNYTLEDLAVEVDAVAAELQQDYKIKNIIPVSISYSAAVSSFLKKYPLIIDAAPMTASAAVNPDLENYRTMLKAGEIFNPIYGPAITRSLLDQTYYTNWVKQVDGIVSQFDLNADRKPDMIKGYASLSRAAEGFVWDLSKTSKETKRVFVLGRNDSTLLLKNQVELALKALEAHADVLVFVVNDSGHVIPNDQPEAYASVLTYVTTKKLKGVNGVFEVEPGNSTPKSYTGADATQFLKDLLKSL